MRRCYVIFIPLSFVLFVFIMQCGERQESKKLADLETGQREDKYVPVEAQIVLRQNLEEGLELTGVLEPLHETDILAEVSGKVVQVNYKTGDFVSVSDTIAQIDDLIPYSHFQQARAQMLSAEANVKIAKLNQQSDEDLYKQGDISQIVYENTMLSLKSAEANLLAAKANYNVQNKQYKDTRIMTPFSGLIAREFVDLGTMVSNGLPLYRVVDLKTLAVSLGVPQSEITLVKIGSQARIRIPALNDRVFKGEVYSISPQADEDTGGFMVDVHIRNTSDLLIRAGMTAKITLLLSEETERIFVQKQAIIFKDNKYYAYKINKNNAKLTPVVLGESIGSYQMIEEGIDHGDTVVVVGMHKLGVDTPVSIEILYSETRTQ